jgi:flagellar biosynthetic protein FliR
VNLLWLQILSLVRISAFIAVFPPWVGTVPKTVKIGLALALTVFWAPVSAGIGNAVAPDGFTGLAFSSIREGIIGAVMAQVVGLVLVPPKIAGAYIAQEMGLTFAAMVSPMDQQPTDPIAQIFEAISLALFFVLDGHHFVMRVIDASWRSTPIGTAWPAPLWIRSATAAIGTVEAGLAIAASVGVLMLIVTVWLALSTRMVAQMHLFSWGAPARVLVGLVAMLIYLPEILMACARSVLSQQARFLLQ